jgi:CheY-like chemotaxis protein
MPSLSRDQSLAQPKATILLVEDFQPLLVGMKSVLEAAGYRVASAGSLKSALQLAKIHHNSLRLLVSRLLMPGFSGPELAETIRAFIPRLKVLYTSDDSPRMEDTTLSTETLASLLPDPFTDEHFLDRVRSALVTAA